VSPDESKIVYTGRFENRRNQQYLSEIFLLAVGDSSATQLTDNEVPEGGLNWMPDNQHFVYSASSDGEWELRQSKLWMMDSGDQSYDMISGSFDGNINNYEISADGETIYFTGAVRTNSNLYSLNIASGDITRHTDETGLLRVVDFTRDQSRSRATERTACRLADAGRIASCAAEPRP
jgi:Tol biopolymer transport system component